MIRYYKRSLTIQFLVPISIGVFLIMLAVEQLLVLGSSNLLEHYIEDKAKEYLESIIVALEISDNSRSNVQRLTNYMSFYDDVEDLFIVENREMRIINASKQKYLDKNVEFIPEEYQFDSVLKATGLGQPYFVKLDDELYLTATQAQILSTSSKHKRRITVLVLTSPTSIKPIFKLTVEKTIHGLTVVLIVGLVFFYALVKSTVLKPVAEIIDVLDRGTNEDKPLLCQTKSENELGRLASTYNQMILERYARRLELLTKNEQLEQLTQKDALTDISNRRYFDQALKSAWHYAGEFKTHLSLIMIDIDMFKAFNDHHGHLKGDLCLQKVANQLATELKRSGHVISRFGGEEFACISSFENYQVVELAELCRKEVENLVIFKDSTNNPISVTISLGVGTMSVTKDSDTNSLISLADKALYKAKSSGKNCVINFNQELSEIIY